MEVKPKRKECSREKGNSHKSNGKCEKQFQSSATTRRAVDAAKGAKSVWEQVLGVLGAGPAPCPAPGSHPCHWHPFKDTLALFQSASA